MKFEVMYVNAQGDLVNAFLLNMKIVSKKIENLSKSQMNRVKELNFEWYQRIEGKISYEQYQPVFLNFNEEIEVMLGKAKSSIDMEKIIEMQTEAMYSFPKALMFLTTLYIRGEEYGYNQDFIDNYMQTWLRRTKEAPTYSSLGPVFGERGGLSKEDVIKGIAI